MKRAQIKKPARCKKFQLRLSESEHKMLAQQASKLNLSISEYIRLLIYKQK